MKRLLILLVLMVTVGLVTGCDSSTSQNKDAFAAGDQTTGGFAPASLDGLCIEFAESDHDVQNKWTFGKDKAKLEDVDGDGFPYTYEHKDSTHSVVVFDVDGKDRYEMTWTSKDGGTCTESFEGAKPSPCTFKMCSK